MTTLASRIVRSKLTVGSAIGATLIKDVATNQTIETYRGNATTYQFTAFDTADAVMDLADVDSVTMRIRASRTYGSTILAEKTLAAADLDLTTNGTTWADGTKQQMEFVFTNSEMNLDPGGEKKNFWLTVTAFLDDGSEVTLAANFITFWEDNNAAADPPPENEGTAITLEEADARYLRKAQEIVNVSADFTLAASDAGKIFVFTSSTIYFVSVPDDLPAGFMCQVLPVGQSVLFTPLGDSEINETTSDVEVYQGNSLITFHASEIGVYNVGNSMSINSICEILGVEIYANLSAANAGIGAINRTYYDQALGRLNQTDALS